jgi:ribosomal protein S18 acetylase RimI-like enzyme
MRAPRPEDAPAVVALVQRDAPEPFDSVWLEREWSEPGFSLEADARLTDEAYVSVWDGHGKAWLDLQGEPDADLLTWAETRAREKGLMRALAGGWAGHHSIKAVLERAGYRLVRHSWRMRVSLDDVAEQPVWPEGITVRPFRSGDERTFYDVHQETFEDHWEHEQANPYEEWAHWLLQPPMFAPDLWFIAEAGGEPAAIEVSHARPEMPGVGWVGILGVRRAWRKRGLGRALLLHAFDEFRARGFSAVGLGVDAGSLTGATRLYESVGMRVTSQFDIYEKHLV